MKFSLILATVDRKCEVERFLASLDAQTYQNFELIVVDQNTDDKIVPLLLSYRNRFSILHVRSKRGSSKARNVGLKYLSGDVVAFPDDDCWYLPNLIAQVARFLCDHLEFDGVTGRIIDEVGDCIARFDTSKGLLNLFNVWQRTACPCIFLRTHVVKHVGKFDETLGGGTGTIWGGGEDIDYPLRAIESGFKIYYDPNIFVIHPNPLKNGYDKAINRAYSYGAGIGRVWKKHNYPNWLVTYYLLRPIGGSLLNFLGGNWSKAYYHWRAFCGRLRGWLFS